MFRIKICGVTTIDDAAAIADAGADAIGLNFYAKSPRSVNAEQARAIRQAVPSLTAVGVFVNASSEEVLRTAREVGLSAAQLHGDEPPDAELRLTGLPVVRARRMGERGAAAIAQDLQASDRAGRRPDAVLVDATAPDGVYGGTGKTIDWAALDGHPGWLLGTPLILAGGLTPANVADAIKRVGPHGVDTASGVESAPGKKDPDKARDFVEAARTAFSDWLRRGHG